MAATPIADRPVIEVTRHTDLGMRLVAELDVGAKLGREVENLYSQSWDWWFSLKPYFDFRLRLRGT